MNFKRIALCAVLSVMTAFSLLSCNDKEKKKKDDFSISPTDVEDVQSGDPFDDATSGEVLEENTFGANSTTVYESIGDAYYDLVDGSIENWDKNCDIFYNLLVDLGVDPLDTDGDKLPDQYEIDTVKTDPELADTDGDGINDAVEGWMHTDPLTYDE